MNAAADPRELELNPEKAFERLEFASLLPPLEERRQVALFLRRVANNLLQPLPYVHIAIEHAGNPLLTCLTLTRQLYPQNDPANDRTERPELFDPKREPFYVP